MKKLIIITLSFLSSISYSQLCGTGQNRGTISPITTVQFTATFNSGRPYWQFTAYKNCQYTFETCGLSTMDTELEILTFPGLTALIYNDDFCGTRSRIVWTAPSSGNYIIYLTRYACRNLNANARVNYVSNCGNPLSVSLISFSGENIENRNILNWITKSEENNDYFTLQKSIDGQTFSEIGTVKSNGEGGMYEFADEQIDNVVNYYKLFQTDFDGTRKEIGNVVAIDNRGMKLLVKIIDTLGSG
jgi:hypothetical protein